jgi:hypothetical protein
MKICGFIFIYTVAFINPRSIKWQKDIKLTIIIIIINNSHRKYDKIKYIKIKFKLKLIK